MTLPIPARSDLDGSERRAALSSAIAAWRLRLGGAHVITEAGTLQAAQTATFATGRRIPAILRPDSTQAVADCVRIAGRFGIPLYAVSRGLNWGFGSRVPSAEGCVLMELTRMDRIVDFSEALSSITVEPGVTFAQVHAWLDARGSQLYASCIGGSPHASLIGNALERGDGEGPHGERSAQTAGLEVVLASGEVLQSGFARFAGARSAALHPHGVGPGLEQLFFQSNLGIVTRMSFPLARKPDQTLAWCGRIAHRDAFIALLGVLRELIQRGAIAPNAVSIWNGWKLLARSRSRHEVEADDAQGAAWYCSGMIEAMDEDHLECLRAIVARALQPVLAELGFSAPNAVRPGEPGVQNLRTAYWGKPAGFNMTNDLDRDRCGLLWLCPALPFDGPEVRQVFDRIEACAAQHGFEPHIGMSASSARQLIAYVTLVWDRDEPGADARARDCHDDLLARLIAAGHLPYRLGIQSMDALPPSTGAYGPTLRAIRALLDPKGIIAPGRYI